MPSTAVEDAPIKKGLKNKLASTDKKAKADAKNKDIKAGAVKQGSNVVKNPTASSGSSKSTRSGKKKSRTKESRGKSDSKPQSGSTSNSQRKKASGSSSNNEGAVVRTDTIKLSCGNDVYYVDSKHFAACSNLIKKELAMNANSRSVDLRQFDKTTVRVLAEYIESKKIKTDISFYSLAELLKFSKAFEMENLRTQLEMFIMAIAANDLPTLHQVLLIIGVTSVSRPTERVILERAARNFMALAAQESFPRIPINVAVPLFARCDLNVKNEVQVVDAMLLWLAGQPNLSAVVASLFYLVRHDFIHSVQKAFIIERARALRFPDDGIAAIERCFDCGNGTRICVLKEHYEAKYTRCGIADAQAADAKQPSMPLSLPRPGIIYKPAPAEDPAATKQGTHALHASEARPHHHACSGSKRKKSKSKSQRGGVKKEKAGTPNQQPSKGSKSSDSHKSSRSKEETKPVSKPKTPGKGKNTSATKKVTKID